MWPQSVLRTSQTATSTPARRPRPDSHRGVQGQQQEQQQQPLRRIKGSGFADVALNVLQAHRGRKAEALRGPFALQDEHDERSEDSYARGVGQPEPWDVRVFWDGAKTPFAIFKCLASNPRVSQLRSALEAAGKIPAASEAVFSVPGAGPLNPIQESFCGLGVFGADRPVTIYMRVGTPVAEAYGSHTSGNNQSEAAQLDAQEDILQGVSDILGKLVAQRGRRVLQKLLDRLDSGADGQLGLEELCALLNGVVERHADAASVFLREDLARAFKRLDKDGSGTLSYAEIVRCLPKHLQTRGERALAASEQAVDDLLQISTKLAGLEKLGFRQRIARRDLVSANNYEGAAGQGRVVHPGLALRGEVEGTGPVVHFRARSIPVLELFAAVDEARTGGVPFEKLIGILRRFQCDCALTQARLREALQAFRLSGDRYDYVGLVDHAIPRSDAERAALMEDALARVRAQLLRMSFSGTRLQHLFARLDPSGSGQVDVQDLRKCLRHDLQLSLSQPQIEEIVRRFDPAREGRVAYADFVAILERGQDRWEDVSALKTAVANALHEAFFDAHLRRTDLTRAFATLGHAETGAISARDLQQALMRLEPPVEADVVSLQRVIHCSRGSMTSARSVQADQGLRIGDLDALLRSAPPRSVEQLRAVLREAVLRTWRETSQNLHEIFTLVAGAPHESPTATGNQGQEGGDDNLRLISGETLCKGAKQGLGARLRRDEAFRVVHEGLGAPRGYEAFVDFVFPAAAPTLHDVAARIQRALKHKSLAGMALRRCFEAFDPRRTGSISEADFVRGVLGLGLGLSRADVTKLLESGLIRQDLHSRRISYDEFVRFALQAQTHCVVSTEGPRDHRGDVISGRAAGNAAGVLGRSSAAPPTARFTSAAQITSYLSSRPF